MIKLPDLPWFMGMLKFRGEGNIYSGSAGCDPVLGSNETNTFRYRVWVQKNDDEFILNAVYYYGLYSYDATDKDIMTLKTFEASESGIAEAQEWLQKAEDEALNKFKINN